MVFFNQLLLSAIIKQYQNSIITDFKFSKSLILCGFREFCLLLPLALRKIILNKFDWVI